MSEKEARALVSSLTEEEKITLYELLSGLEQNRERAARPAD